MRIFLLITLLALTLGCDQKTPEATANNAVAQADTKKSGDEDKTKAPTEAKLPAVTVSKEGTKFDPPVEKAQVTSGSWICDMGTVHYARSEKGDGTCPICHMKLKELKH